MNHTLHKCSNEQCQICEGGLQSCIVCGGAEITLPTECPGRWMTDALMDKVRDKIIDFNGGVWEAIKE